MFVNLNSSSQFIGEEKLISIAYTSYKMAKKNQADIFLIATKPLIFSKKFP